MVCSVNIDPKIDPNIDVNIDPNIDPNIDLNIGVSIDLNTMISRPHRQMYKDFEEGVAVDRISQLPPHVPRTYIPIRCPRCKTDFVEIPIERLQVNKAGECLKHKRVCPDYKGSVAPAPEKKATMCDLVEQMKAMREENRVQTEQMKAMREENSAMREENRTMTRRIAEGLGLGDPLPDDEKLLVNQANAKEHEACKRARREERKRKMNPSAMIDHLNLNTHMRDPSIARKVKALRTCLSSDDPLATLLDKAIPTSGSKPDDTWNATGSRAPP